MAMYRGLSTFITDIRNCKTKEKEQERVDKELANIRSAFTSGAMTPYDRKKYVWKLVYINMLGYDVDFGHMEMIELVSSGTYAEKLVGYLSTAVMMRNTDDQITLVVQAIKKDLQSTQDPIQCLALAAIANIGGKELAETVAPDVQRILFSRSIFPVVRKKAALCLLRLVRISRDLLPADEWSKKLITLLEDRHLGVVLSVVTLILGLAERDPSSYEGATGYLLVWLTRLAVNKHVTEDYMYHGTPCPWLQVRILRLLQCFPIPATEAMRTRLNEVVGHILAKTEVTKSVNRNNAEHCVLFEAVNLIIKQGDASTGELRGKAVAHLSKFINIREPNIRYLGLETMARLVALEGTGEAIRKQQATIMFSLKDADISIRRRALDLLFAMCDVTIAQSVVGELLTYLAIADYAIKDEMVLKLAILAERFAPDKRWYVDTILQLISIAGDYVSDDIWHRVVQIVTNQGDLQRYAASKMFHALEPTSAHETAVKVGGYVLGEFGYLLTTEGDLDGSAVSGAQLFAVLHQHFPKCSVSTKCLLFSAYAKLQNLFTELRPLVLPIFEAHTTVIDAELQQRALEYIHLPSLSTETLEVVLEAIPAFPERASMLEARLKRAGEETHDKDVWAKEGDKPVAASGATEGEEGGAAAGTAGASGCAGASSSATTAAASASGGDDDLLGLGALSPVASTPTATATGPVDPTTVPVTRRIALDAAQEASVASASVRISLAKSGVLFEDANVQVGIKCAFTGAEGKVGVYIGNRLSIPLVGLRVRVAAPAGLKADIAPGADVPSSIAAGAQVIIPIALESLTPFTDAPRLLIAFISQAGTGHELALRLPAAIHNFCEPFALSGDVYKGQWGKLAEGATNVTAGIKPAAASGVTVEGAKAALAKINMQECDTGAAGATAASSFRTHSVGPTGAHVSVGCLAMVIPAPDQGIYKVAVRTQHPDVSKALMASLQAALEA